jgi:hypothetical protein
MFFLLVAATYDRKLCVLQLLLLASMDKWDDYLEIFGPKSLHLNYNCWIHQKVILVATLFHQSWFYEAHMYGV